jgi:hypothetical protein
MTPTWSAPSTVPLSSPMRSSTSGSAWPQLPAMRAPDSGFEVSMPVSVMP